MGNEVNDPLSSEDSCFSVFCIIIHGCLESFLTCVEPAILAAWAAPLALDFDFVRFYEHMWAREGWRSHSLIPHSGIDCSSILAASKRPTVLDTDQMTRAFFLSDQNSTTTQSATRRIQAKPGTGSKLHSYLETTDVDDLAPYGDDLLQTRESHMPAYQHPKIAARHSTDSESSGRGRDDDSQSVVCNGERILVFYSYFEGPRAIRSLRTFLEQTKDDWRKEAGCSSGLRLELVLIISGHRCSVPLPSARNVRILRIDNTGTDFGGYAEALMALGISLSATSWRKHYSFLIFINSSCRGPFLPSYVQGLHWTVPFTSKITDQVKIHHTSR